MANISIQKADKDLWFDFVAKVKKENKEVWDVLEVFIKEYLRSVKK